MSYKILCDLEGHLTFGVNGKVNSYSFYYRSFRPFITPSILDQISSIYQPWSLTKGLPVAEVLRHHYILNKKRKVSLRCPTLVGNLSVFVLSFLLYYYSFYSFFPSFFTTWFVLQ